MKFPFQARSKYNNQTYFLKMAYLHDSVKVALYLQNNTFLANVLAQMLYL